MSCRRHLSILLGIDHHRQNQESNNAENNPTGLFLGCFTKKSEHVASWTTERTIAR